MIKTKYTLIQETGTKSYTFETPDELKTLQNLSLIEAPNNFGKSTLFHIIALSCYGENEYFQKRIGDPGLLEKISMLYKESSVKLQFSLTIEAHNNIFKAEKRDFDRQSIVRTINGEPTSFEDFKENFDIVYQIPSKPVTRLNDIIKDVTRSVSDYCNKIESHADNLEEIITELANDPKKRIKELKDQIVTDKENLLIDKERKRDLEKEYKHLNDFIIIRDYNKSFKEREDLRKELSELEKVEDKKTAKVDQHNQTVKNVNSFNTDIHEIRKTFIGKVDELDLRDNDLDEKIETLKTLDLFSDFANNSGETFWHSVLDVLEIVGDYHEGLVSDEKVVSAEYLKKLKSILDDFPAEFDDSSISEVVGNLLNNVNQYLDSTSDGEFDVLFKDIYNIRDKMDKLHTGGVKIFKKYNSLSNEEKTELNISDNQLKIASLKAQIKNYDKPIEKLEKTLETSEYDHKERRNFELWFKTNYKSLGRLPLERLKSEKQEKFGRLEGTKKNISRIKTAIERRNNEIIELEGRQSDEFLNDKKELDEIQLIFQDLLNKLTTLENNLELSSDESLVGNLDDSFQDELQKFLAQNIPTIPFEQDGKIIEHNVKRIDHIKKLFITENDEKILFAWYGSGRTSSLAFLSTINNISPDKLTVLLLDEALMDDTSFEPLINAALNKYKDGNIFAALFARYSSNINVKSLIK